MAFLKLFDTVVCDLEVAPQGVIYVGFIVTLPTPATTKMVNRVVILLILYLHFYYGVVGDSNSPPTWGDVKRFQGKVEMLATLDQALIRGIPPFCNNFGVSEYFSNSLPLI